MSTVSPHLLAFARAQLTEAERIAWAMCPEPAACPPKARRKGLGAVVILGGGYATLGAIWTALRSGNWLWLTVPLGLLLLGALAYLVVRRLEARRIRTLEGTVYVLTTRRALVVNTYPALSVQTLSIASISDVTLSDARGPFADLSLSSAPGLASMVFRGIFEPEQARTQLLRVVRDPSGTDRQIADSERYLMAMRQFTRSVT
jgi:hypothetical protein